MHPARSIILFTTLSGLGFGLLTCLGFGVPAVTGGMAFVFFLIAYGLAVGGLAASTFHLGHPERALLAFTQWRSSWLSREGWAAVAALLLMAPHAIGLVFFATPMPLFGVLGSLAALVTIGTTSMIYTQLKTVPRWHHWTTPALFFAYALGGGTLLAGQITVAIPLLLIAAVLQTYAWHMGDSRFRESGSTTATATGLKGGQVRLFEPPHTGGNYLTKEMVHQVARKHSQKLRMIALALGMILPVLLLLLPFTHLFALVAVLSHIAGVLTARWLFFAEAEHVVGLYYGRTA